MFLFCFYRIDFISTCYQFFDHELSFLLCERRLNALFACYYFFSAHRFFFCCIIFGLFVLSIFRPSELLYDRSTCIAYFPTIFSVKFHWPFFYFYCCYYHLISVTFCSYFSVPIPPHSIRWLICLSYSISADFSVRLWPISLLCFLTHDAITLPNFPVFHASFTTGLWDFIYYLGSNFINLRKCKL